MSTILMFGIWALMTVTALLLLEVNLTFAVQASTFSSMAYKTLGRTWQAATWFAALFLFYALLAAYTSGGSALLSGIFTSIFNVTMPSWASSLLFMVILSAAVLWSTRAVDCTNRFLITFKGLFLVASIVLLMPHIDLTKIISDQGFQSSKYLGIAAPIFLCAFGFHGSIPSIRIYVGDNRKALRLIVICGTTIPLIIYLLWVLGALCTIPLVGETNSFAAIKAGGNSVAELIAVISAIVNNKLVVSAISGFSSISMTTSFLGVSLGLFDFLADGFKRPNTRSGRFQTYLLTFIPPLIFALFYPKGFVLALGYAAIFLSFLAVILPAAMAYKLRQDKRLLATNKILFSRSLLITIVLIGVVLIALQVTGNLKLIPA